MKPSRAAARRYLPASPFNPTAPPLRPVETYAVQDRVTHDKYGLGVVLRVDADVAVLVDFGPQRLLIRLPCGKLTKL